MHLPPGLPSRGNALSLHLGRAALHALGWRIEGALPDLPKLVAIVAPHTSNWDFVVGVAALFTLGVDVRFLGKDALFRWPLAPMMRWLGGIPVERSTSHDVVEQTVAQFARRERMILALTPEGTRRKVERWRTGFYYIALGAHVPIVPIAFDWGRKTIRIGAPFTPTGTLEADLDALAAFYSGVQGRRPELGTLR